MFPIDRRAQSGISPQTPEEGLVESDEGGPVRIPDVDRQDPSIESPWRFDRRPRRGLCWDWLGPEDAHEDQPAAQRRGDVEVD